MANCDNCEDWFIPWGDAMREDVCFECEQVHRDHMANLGANFIAIGLVVMLEITEENRRALNWANNYRDVRFPAAVIEGVRRAIAGWAGVDAVEAKS